MPKRSATPRAQKKYKGVRQRPERHGFLANVAGHALGQFPTAEAAAIAHDRVARHFGYDASKLNFPKRDLEPATVEQMRSERRTLRKTTASSAFYGVHWNNREQQFRATLNDNGRSYYLGSFKDELEAARRVDAATYKLRGSSAPRNFPEEKPAPIRLSPPKARTSKYVGVFQVRSGRWTARLFDTSGRIIGLGSWDTEREAAVAHDQAVLHVGARSRLNFPRRMTKPSSPADVRAAARRAFKESKTSTFRGVHQTPSGAWCAQICSAQVDYRLGTFEFEEEAAEAYDVAALYFHGDDAILNFPANRARSARKRPTWESATEKRRRNRPVRKRGPRAD